MRAALFVVWSQVGSGVMCPVSMTYAAIPPLRENAELAAEWEPRLTKPSYDDGALAGMAMTEKQGGSDVRANTTRAEPQSDGTYEITGHKWFCSYPPCDVFLTLAQAPAGLSCFLFEGRDPGFRIQRLKDKLGTRSLPSSEVEFHGVRGRLIGEEGRGVATIIRMVNHTRLDCLLGSTASMRWGLAQAVHHTRHRSAFGKLLAEQPAMQNVLADLAVESEAATTTAMRIARSYDEDDAAFRRFATAVAKYWVCKRAAPHAAEALECLGGNGYVEESGMPRLLRDAPLNSIWEGSGNVAALDVLRAMVKEPEGLPAFMAECELGRGGNALLDAHLDRLATAEPPTDERRAPGRRGPGAGAPGEPARPQRPLRGGRRVLRRAAGRGRARLRNAAGERGRAGDRRARAGRLGGRQPLGGRIHFDLPNDDSSVAERPDVRDGLPHLHAALPTRTAELHGGDDLVPGVSDPSGSEPDVVEGLDHLAGGLHQPLVTVKGSLGPEDGRGLPDFDL